MQTPIDIAVVGATGAVGRLLVLLLEKRGFPVGDLHLLASARSAGKIIQYRGLNLEVKALDEFDFSQVKLCFFSAGKKVSEEYVPKAVEAGCIVIDNTSCFRYDDDVPLVIPEVNAQAINDHQKRSIIANPNCSTIQLLVALKPIHDAVGIKRIIVSTYQAVSGAGQSVVDELKQQISYLMNEFSIESNVFSEQFAFNVLPKIDEFEDNGYTREEMKISRETKKILDDKILVSATAVRVPVVNCHSEAVTIETDKLITPEEAVKLLETAPGVKITNTDQTKDFPQPINVYGSDDVYVGRIRPAEAFKNGLSMWIVGDNLRKGAATNAIQIAEILTK
ncbi:MAG: aspartate-semialdehyde dehydrogenase [Gammaproteobacteria bacterium]